MKSRLFSSSARSVRRVIPPARKAGPRLTNAPIKSENESAKYLMRAGIVYAATVNLGAYGLFWYDKQQALHKGWRIPEHSLQMSALLGGWIGGMLAMQHFRHKTRKEPFRTWYFLCVGVNAVSLVGLGFAMTKSTVRQRILHQLRSTLR